MRKPYFLISILSFISFSTIYADESPQNIAPYKVVYDLQRGDTKVGKTVRSLEQLDNGAWQLTMSSEASILVVSFKYFQQSTFSWVNNQPRPNDYLQTESSTFKSKKTHKQHFDWATFLEDGSYKKKKWQIELPPLTQDKQTSLLNLRLELLKQNTSNDSLETFHYPVSYKGKISDVVYQLIGKELIETAEGEFETLKFKKVRKNNKRASFFWLAKDLNYLPVKIQQWKKGKEQATMLLSSIKQSSTTG